VHGGGGERTRFVCGYLACDSGLCRPLIGALPRMLRVPLGDGPGAAWLMSLARRGAQENTAPGPGSGTLLAKLAETLGLTELSMGMSGDFVRAIAFGSTYVRIGTAIFGERVA